MTKAHKKMVAACAQASRWANNTAYPTEQTDENAPEISNNSEQREPIDLGSQSDSDCGYNGGVNCWPDSDYRDCSCKSNPNSLSEQLSLKI
jgi:hypothetical protein